MWKSANFGTPYGRSYIDCVKGSSSLKFMVLGMDCSDEFDAFGLLCDHTEFEQECTAIQWARL